MHGGRAQVHRGRLPKRCAPVNVRQGTDEGFYDTARNAHRCMPGQPRYLGGQHSSIRNQRAITSPEIGRLEVLRIHAPARSALAQQPDQVFQFLVARLAARERTEEGGQFLHQFLILQHVVRDAPGIHRGVVRELAPVVRAWFEVELSGLYGGVCVH